MSKDGPGPIGAKLIGGLLDEHGPALVLFARQFCKCPEDAVQEAFVKLARQPRPPDAPVPWLYRVVRNAALSASRAERRRRRREERVAHDRPDWFVSGHEEAIDARLASDVVADLPDEQREAVVLRIWAGMTFEEMAAVAGVTSSTAHRRYSAGIESIRERMGLR